MSVRFAIAVTFFLNWVSENRLERLMETLNVNPSGSRNPLPKLLPKQHLKGRRRSPRGSVD